MSRIRATTVEHSNCTLSPSVILLEGLALRVGFMNGSAREYIHDATF